VVRISRCNYEKEFLKLAEYVYGRKVAAVTRFVPVKVAVRALNQGAVEQLVVAEEVKSDLVLDATEAVN